MARPRRPQVVVVPLKLWLVPGRDDDIIRFLETVPPRQRAAAVLACHARRIIQPTPTAQRSGRGQCDPGFPGRVVELIIILSVITVSWFTSPPDPDEIRCKVTISFLRSLEARLSNERCSGALCPPSLPFSVCVSAIETGLSPESVLSEFGSALADLLLSKQYRIADLLRQVRLDESRIAWYIQENDHLRNEPVRQKLGRAQQQIRDLTQRAEKAERDLAATRRALEAEQTARQHETRELQRAFVTQNSIIAKQRIQLDNLGLSTLQGEPSDAETPEAQS